MNHQDLSFSDFNLEEFFALNETTEKKLVQQFTFKNSRDNDAIVVNNCIYFKKTEKILGKICSNT